MRSCQFAMRCFFFLICLSASVSCVDAEQIDGNWVGRLSESMGNLKIVFRIKTLGSKLHAKMDSPDQGVQGLVVPQVKIDGDKLSMENKSQNWTYEGTLDVKSNVINGTFKQSGLVSGLNLKPLDAILTKVPKQISFTYNYAIPKDFLPSSGKGVCAIHLHNETTDSICLAAIDSDGNICNGWSDGRTGYTLFYVRPSGRTNPSRPYNQNVGDVFVILTSTGRILGYGKVWEAGECDLTIE